MELRGKREICKYMRRGWKVILRLKVEEKFPVTMVGRVWISDTVEIRSWQLQKLRRRDG